jgi:proteasome lid subunit RPN8/RPN11
MSISDTLLAAVCAHAEKESPRESCGLIVIRKGRRRYWPCKNLAAGAENFVLDPLDYAAAEDFGVIEMVVHSHPYLSPEPSKADMVGIEKSQLPWLIVNWPVGHYTITEPSGFQMPLIGREFVPGVLDCLTLIQDYYYKELGIDLPDYEREDRWWEKGQNLYLDLYQDCGFELVSDLKAHDVLLMQVASPVPNHGAVLLPNGNIIHHQSMRISSEDVYGGWYRKITTHHLRHRSLMK